MEIGGIFECTFQEFYAMDELMHFRGNCFINFFTQCMAVLDRCDSISKILFELTKEYHMLYNRHVSKTSGPIEKRQKAGKVMIFNLESKRIEVRHRYQIKFINPECIRDVLGMLENEEVGDSFHEESNLIYCHVEDLSYMNFWEWMQKGKGQSVHDYIKERPSDLTYQFCETMLDKIYDITGYLCGHRIGCLLQKNRLKSDYKWVFVAYHSNSRLENGYIDLLQGLPAELSLFREHSGGLYHVKKHIFDFNKVIHAIWIQQCFRTCEAYP